MPTVASCLGSAQHLFERQIDGAADMTGLVGAPTGVVVGQIEGAVAQDNLLGPIGKEAFQFVCFG